MKKLTIFLLTLLSGSFAFGQDAAAPSFWDDPVNNPLTPLYLVTALIFVVILLVMVVALYLLRILNVLVKQAEMERAQRLGIVYKPQPTVWEKLWQSANEFVPVEQEQKIELDHNYDGIRELDNHLPPWWKSEPGRYSTLCGSYWMPPQPAFRLPPVEEHMKERAFGLSMKPWARACWDARVAKPMARARGSLRRLCLRMC